MSSLFGIVLIDSIRKEMKYLYLILIAILLLCLFSMPYGYYMFVRYVAMVAFGVMAYQFMKKDEKGWAVTFGALALLFQPFIKIVLGRTIWNVVDVIVAVLLIVVWVKETNISISNKEKIGFFTSL